MAIAENDEHINFTNFTEVMTKTTLTIYTKYMEQNEVPETSFLNYTAHYIMSAIGNATDYRERWPPD